MQRVRDRALRIAAPGVLVLAGLVLGAAYVSGRTTIALALLAAVAGLGLLAVEPAAFAVLAVPAVFLVERLSVGPVDLTYTDALVIVAAAIALPTLLVRPPDRDATLLLQALVVYLGLLLLTVAFHPDTRSLAELVHRAALVGGSVVVGLAVVRAHREALALRLLLAVGLVIAVAATVASVQSGFEPAFPLGLHKNFAGSLLGTLSLLALIAYPAFDLPRRLRLPVLATLLLGLGASQSRGALLGLAAGALLLVFTSGLVVRTGYKLLAIIGAGFLLFAIVTSVQAQLEAQRTGATRIDSLTQREAVEQATFALFKADPVVGVGLKFYTEGGTRGADQAPNNVLNESLAEAGVVGLVGFLLLQSGGMLSLRRAKGQLAVAAVSVVLARLVHGQVDIYWSAGTASLPWLVAGLALGMSERSRAEHRAAARDVVTA